MAELKGVNLVVGSGPAGVSCAVALLAQGRRVTMLDSGLELEAWNAEQVRELQGISPQQWTGREVEFLRGGMQADVDGIPLKRAYGSDYPYRTPAGATAVRCAAADTKASFAKGGLSNVWGAALMPYRQADMGGWPITEADLGEHYRAVAGFMPVAMKFDGLTEHFPAHTDVETPLDLSPQARALLANLDAHRQQLRDAKVAFGQSRLAVNATGAGAPGPCVRCGLCMYGCPYRLIYSTADTVESLKRNANFAYIPDCLVARVSEAGETASVEMVSRSGEKSRISGSRVYLAAGVISTTAILLRSLEKFDTPVKILDSHYFLLPMLRLAGVKGFQRGDLHTLAQLFLEIMDDAVSPNTVHLQAYTYNDLFEAPIRQKLGPLAAMFPWRQFLSRLFLFQGYVHSSQSGSMTATLRALPEGDRLDVDGHLSPATDLVVSKLVRKLRGLRGATGAVPLSPLLRRGEPGRGFHTGGSFPMRGEPGAMESDVFGRPAGLRRIHAVDSSVLPSVAATTITYTVMANAHRIGSQIASYARMDGEGAIS